MNLVSTSTGVKNIGGFLEALAKTNPHLMSQHFASLKEQIDSPAHQIRSSLLHAMGLVVAYIHREVEALNSNSNQDKSVDSDASNKQPTDDADGNVDGPAAVVAGGDTDADTDAANADNDDVDADTSTDNTTSPSSRAGAGSMNAAQLTRIRDAFLDLLVERTHDVSPFTRANVLKVWVTPMDSPSLLFTASLLSSTLFSSTFTYPPYSYLPHSRTSYPRCGWRCWSLSRSLSVW